MNSHAAAAPAPAPLGMKIFLVSDAVTFIALWVVATLVSGSMEPAPSAATGAAMTGCLALVSLAMWAGARRMSARLAAALAAVMGVVFLALTFLEYRELFAGGLDPRGSLAAASFLLLTGFHAAHVLVGVALAGRRAVLPGPLRATALYWHFVDLVWVAIFVGLYS